MPYSSLISLVFKVLFGNIPDLQKTSEGVNITQIGL